MKRVSFLVLLCAAVCMVSLLPAQDSKPKAAPAGTKDLTQKASYCIGLTIGRDFKNQGLDLDSEQLAQGLRDALSGAKPKLEDADIEQILTEFRTQLAAMQQEKSRAASEKHKKEGAAFLAANGKKEGVKTTASGLQYQVIKEGTGAAPKATDVVEVHYKGTLLDGTEFDSSYKRGEPIKFPLDGVIKGWTEGVQLMKVGGTTRFFIPSELAYGENPQPGGPIPPNAVLIFDVELRGIGK